MSRLDRLALVLSLITVLVTYWIAGEVFERVPHLEDEMAFVWQAEVFARGRMAVESPECPRCFLQPFVVDYNGLRFGKYPPGWPAVLALGVRFDARDWVNPLLAGLCVWLTYRLVQKLLDEKTALLAAGLTLVSPFFLMNAGSLLSHVWSFFLVLALAFAWFDLLDEKSTIPRWMSLLVAGLSLGLLALTRPLTAVGVALPFFLHGLVLLVRGSTAIRKRVLGVGLISAPVTALLFLWQFGVTGDPLLNPYELWWPYDKIGFGPDVGLNVGGHSPWFAYVNAKFSLKVGASDLFGWPRISWLFLPFGLIAVRKNPRALIVASGAVSLVGVYLLYWIASWLFGPRYYFEGLIGMTMLTAAGIRWLAGRLPPRPWKDWLPTLRFAGTVLVVALLVSASVLYYSPARLGSMRGLYGVRRSHLAPFLTPEAQALTPALVIVHPHSHWIEYGTLLELSNPFLDSPFVFTYSRGPELDAGVIARFPDRTVWHYYPDEPYTFYSAARPVKVD